SAASSPSPTWAPGRTPRARSGATWCAGTWTPPIASSGPSTTTTSRWSSAARPSPPTSGGTPTRLTSSVSASDAPSVRQLGDGREQVLGVGMLGRVDDPVGGVQLDQPPFLHHRDPVGDIADDVEVVGDDEQAQRQPSTQ